METPKFIAVLMLSIIFLTIATTSVMVYKEQQSKKDYTLELKSEVIYLTNTDNGKTYGIKIPKQRQADVRKDFEEIRKLEGTHRYLSNAINQINEAKDYLK